MNLFNLSTVRGKKEKLFYIQIVITGLLILSFHLYRFKPPLDIEMIFLVITIIITTLLGAFFPIREIYFTLNFPFLVVAVLIRGAAAAMWILLPNALFSFFYKKVNLRVILFNLSQYTISIYVASLFIPDNFKEINLFYDLIWIIPAAVIADLINFSLILKLISLEQHKKFFKLLYDVWLCKMFFLHPLAYSTGIVMTISYQAQGMTGLIMAAFPVLGISHLISTKKELNIETLRANTDSLTEIGNRRALFNWWQKQFEEIRENNIDVSLLMIDIDDFKRINDNYGHDVGDKVLVKLTEIIRSLIRKNDRIYRYGGEEFVVILPAISLKKAKEIAEKISSSVFTFEILPDRDIYITISIGLSFLTDDLRKEKNKNIFAELIRQADQAMYLAKSNGKGRVCVYM